jgi:hypothetical protein
VHLRWGKDGSLLLYLGSVGRMEAHKISGFDAFLAAIVGDYLNDCMTAVETRITLHSGKLWKTVYYYHYGHYIIYWEQVMKITLITVRLKM